MATEERIRVLENFVLEGGEDNPAGTITIDTTSKFNYKDGSAYDSRWVDEVTQLIEMEDLMKRGEYFVNLVYTYRCCSKALPQVKSTEQPNRNQIYDGTIEILEPEIRKLKDFMYFQKETNEKFCEYIKQFIYGKKKPSELFMWNIVQMLDLLALLDVLKNMKASLNNDFSAYKRALGFSKKKAAGQADADKQTQENHQLYLFLANQSSITTQLKSDLEASELEGYQEVLVHIANMCADYMETEKYVTPQDKFKLLRVMPYIIFLMDHADPKKSFLKLKTLKPERFAKIFKQYPIVPLYGDMQTTLVTVLQRAPNYDEETWGVGRVSDTKLAVEYEIIHSLQQVRSQYTGYLAKFNSTMNEIKLLQRNYQDSDEATAHTTASPNSIPGSTGLPDSLMRDIRNLVLRGFSLLSDWTGKVLAQSAWKYAHPNNDEKIQSEVDYERYIRYNFDSNEKFALIEFIAMLKGLAAVMMKEEALLVPILRADIHNEVQDFIQVSIRDMLKPLVKKMDKKKPARDELMELRKLAGDWKDGLEPDDLNPKAKNAVSPPIPKRAVPPSPTQLDIIRNIVYGFRTQRGKKELFGEKEFSDQHLKVLDVFYQNSFYYPYLLDFQGTIKTITDLGDLWYREFYLELTKRLQFEIDMSLAWILCDHVLETANTAMTEFLLFPLEIYNDAAQRALGPLNQRFMYDEIEAEVNLAFDQLVYKLSDQTYNYYKIKASTLLLDKEFKRQLEGAYPDKIFRFNAPKSRLEVLFKQRHLQLLGRSIDINALVSQRINNSLRRNLHYAISRFEASPITGIIEFEMLFNNIKLMHHLMSEHLQLDPWESILAESNNSASLVSFHGRIALHVLFEIISDLTPNFVFNGATNRYIRASSLGRAEEDVPREAMPKPNIQFLYGNKLLTNAYAQVADLTSTFFGLPHLLSTIRLVGKSNVPLLFEQVLQNMDLKLHNVLEPYFRQVLGGMPSDKSSLPMYDYGTFGGFQYFQAKMKDIIAYPVLVTEVFQHFREWGNALILLHQFEDAIKQIDCIVSIQSAPFIGVVPQRSRAKKSKDAQTAANSAAAEANSTGGSPLCKTLKTLKATVDKAGGAKVATVMNSLAEEALRAEKVHRPHSRNHSPFKIALVRVQRMLEAFRESWAEGEGDNEVLPIDSTTEFYRIWSAIQFVFLNDVEDNTTYGKSSQELFGDGIIWAGISIIHFLGQRCRFEALDFSYHIYRMNEVLPTDDNGVLTFLHRLASLRDVNDTVFRTLESYLPVTPSPAIDALHPPKSEQASKFLNTEGTGAAVKGGGGGGGAAAVPPPATGGGGGGATTNLPPPPPSNFSAPPPPPPVADGGESGEEVSDEEESDEGSGEGDDDASGLPPPPPPPGGATGLPPPPPPPM